MNGIEYKEFDDAEYTRFRIEVPRTKGSERQHEFLHSVRCNESFLEFFRRSMSTSGSCEMPLISDRLTENEFKDPPTSTEASLHRSWIDLTPSISCRTTFWAFLTCRHIEQGKVDAIYLAANGQAGVSGAERVDLALRDGAAKSIDDCVRNVLRRLGGLPGVRGKRSVYVDCPFARAWWRERLVADISRGDGECADLIREVVRVSQTYWENLVDLIVSRNSVLGSGEVRNAFILALANLFAENLDSPLRTAKNLRLACRVLGAIQASRELSILDLEDIQRLMNELVQSQHTRTIT